MLFNIVSDHVQKNLLSNTLTLTSWKLYIHINPLHYLPNTFGMIIFPGTFTEHLFTNTDINFTAPGRMCFAAAKYYTCPTEK
jgi:hypothetical protein